LRSVDFARIVGINTRHQKTKPYTPRHNAKAERFQRILAEEVLYAREYGSEDERSAAIRVWNNHYNFIDPTASRAAEPSVSTQDRRHQRPGPSTTDME
jgi:hypothetical protein